ncbi:MAG TPA: DUF2953 domain-containing protein [Candidatus Pygmaiobacter gallistercoris]|nr:DUF2953 domain-containing protein [Candidatus Pygmaiobacter gallistercoris]
MSAVWILPAVLLVLVLLLAALLFLPVWVIPELKYDQLTVRLQLLFLTFTVYPFREKKKKKKEQPQREEPPQEQKKQRSPSAKFEWTASRVVRLAADAAGILRMALAALRVRKIRILLPLQGEDAADTALFYGRFSGWFYGLIAALQNFMDLKFEQIELIPDFAGENKYRRSFYCKIGATPFIMLVVMVKGFRLLQQDGLLPGGGPGRPAAKKRGTTEQKTAATGGKTI